MNTIIIVEHGSYGVPSFLEIAEREYSLDNYSASEWTIKTRQKIIFLDDQFDA